MNKSSDKRGGYDRLKRVEERLRALGVRDVKFTPAGGWTAFMAEPSTSGEVLANDLAALLESYLEGRYVVRGVYAPSHALQNNALAPGQRKTGEIAGYRNDDAPLARDVQTRPTSQERVSNPVECTPSTTPQKPRGAYVPLTEEQIEVWREHWRNAPRFTDDAINPEEIDELDRLCNMAVNSLLYAQEIDRLRTTVSAIARITEEEKNLAAVTVSGVSFPADWKARALAHARVVLRLYRADCTTKGKS